MVKMSTCFLDFLDIQTLGKLKDRHFRAHDAAGNQVQRGFLAVNHERMAGVVSPLITGNDADLVGQQIYDFAFAFVTPLGTQHH